MSKTYVYSAALEEYEKKLKKMNAFEIALYGDEMIPKNIDYELKKSWYKAYDKIGSQKAKKYDVVGSRAFNLVCEKYDRKEIISDISCRYGISKQEAIVFFENDFCEMSKSEFSFYTIYNFCYTNDFEKIENLESNFCELLNSENGKEVYFELFSDMEIYKKGNNRVLYRGLC